MSIAVELAELPTALQQYPWGYLVTVGDDGRARSLAVPTDCRQGLLHAEVGKGTAANIAARPAVTMVFPGVDGTVYSLIVDGTATVVDGHATLVPEWAVLHRPALPDGE